MGEPICAGWVAEASPGRTFAEVGGLWGTVNEQATTAALAGAAATTMIDIAPSDGGPDDLWRLFRERADSMGVGEVRFVNGSIDDPATGAAAGSFEVVCCNGVLYHCPDPIHTLRRLRAITTEVLILGTVSIPERIETSAGSIEAAPGSALLVPALGSSQLAIASQWLRDLGDPGIQADGITHPAPHGWAADAYDPWWWLFTRDHVRGLLEVCGFEVERVASYWEGRASLFFARVA